MKQMTTASAEWAEPGKGIHRERFRAQIDLVASSVPITALIDSSSPRAVSRTQSIPSLHYNLDRWRDPEMNQGKKNSREWRVWKRTSIPATGVPAVREGPHTRSAVVLKLRLHISTRSCAELLHTG